MKLLAALSMVLFGVSCAHAQGPLGMIAGGSGGTTPEEPPSAICEDTFPAASASRIAVLAAIALTDAGDCVTVPADASESWAGGITISGISLIGPGKDNGSPTVITAGLVTLTKHATEVTRLIGFRFTGGAQHVQLDGSVSDWPFVVHNNYFNVGSGGSCGGGTCWADIDTNGGIFSENTVVAPTATSSDLFKVWLSPTADATSWGAATTYGTGDTDGETNTYFEGNHWENLLEIAIDCDNGARVVMRHENFQDSSVTAHGGGSGTSGQDTSSFGCRQLEIYDSTFDRVDAFVPVNKWMWLRGGTMVFANNVVDEVNSSEYGGKRELILSVGCPGEEAYPLDFQVGQSTVTPDATPNQPVLIFGNTGTHAGLINISGDSGGGITCASPSTYIQSGRDYQTSNTWGWVGYEYPHPLHPTIDGSGDL